MPVKLKSIRGRLKETHQQGNIQQGDNCTNRIEQNGIEPAVFVFAHYFFRGGKIDLQKNGERQLDTKDHLGINQPAKRI
jgi:hypothetical protein